MSSSSRCVFVCLFVCFSTNHNHELGELNFPVPDIVDFLVWSLKKDQFADEILSSFKMDRKKKKEEEEEKKNQ